MKMNGPSDWGHSTQQSLFGVAVAPMAGVLLSLMALWIAGMPRTTHAVAVYLSGGCPELVGEAPQVHSVVIGPDGVVSWDSSRLSNRAALDAKLQAVGAMAPHAQAQVQIRTEDDMSYGAVVAVLAAAQRNGVLRMAVSAPSSSFKSDGRCASID